MNALNRLHHHIIDVPVRLSALSEEALTHHAPGKWSRKEVLGHLIDSAINNLKRFTDAQVADGPYLIQPYNQDQLVFVNQYQNLPLSHLLTLWSSLNRQILFVTEAIPADNLTRLIQVALTPDKSQTKPLIWLIEDYVMHLEHHLNAIE